MDEADRMLEIGFEDEMRQIIRMLPAARQTMLFSATQTTKVEDLARLSLQKPLYIGVDDAQAVATASRLEQGYCVVPSASRFLLLFTFLKKNRGKKIMVFFSSCASVKYHAELLNYIDVPVLARARALSSRGARPAWLWRSALGRRVLFGELGCGGRTRTRLTCARAAPVWLGRGAGAAF